jgi:ABC-type Fe3+/spermidine/putrescine transport system ATPase subunit
MTGSDVLISGVSKIYNGSLGNGRAVDDLTLHVSGSEVLTLLGSSGSGKTTTLRIIAGLERLTAGEVRIDGKLVSSPEVQVPPHKRRIGMVFQNYALWPHMTVADNVAFPLKVTGVSKRERALRAHDVLGEVDLAGYGDRLPGQLSGGQQQRVALARAIVGDPGIILYDEPLSNLDARLRDRLRDQIRSLHDRLGITAVYVTHDQREAMAISDRVAMMASGRLQQVGTPKELYLTPSRRSVAEFVGDANIVPVQKYDSDLGIAHLSDELSIKVPTPRQTADELASSSIFLLVRPHDIQVRPGSSLDAENAFPATVKRVRFFGQRLEVTVALEEGISLLAEVQIASDSLLSVGQRVVVGFEREQCMLVI